MGFLLLGAIWSYQKVDDTIRAAVEPAAASPADAAAVARLTAADERLFAAEEGELAARDRMELAREAYRTALDADQPAGALERAYEDAQAAYEQAQLEVAVARDEVAAATPAAEAAGERIAAERQRAGRLESLGSSRRARRPAGWARSTAAPAERPEEACGPVSSTAGDTPASCVAARAACLPYGPHTDCSPFPCVHRR